MRIIFLLFTLALLAYSKDKVDNELVSLTNLEGKTIQVILIEEDDKSVKCRFENSQKILTVNKEDLSDDSLGVVKKWKESGGDLSFDLEVYNVKIDLKGVEVLKSGTSSRSFIPIIKIRNKDKFKKSAPGRMEIFCMQKNNPSESKHQVIDVP